MSDMVSLEFYIAQLAALEITGKQKEVILRLMALAHKEGQILGQKSALDQFDKTFAKAMSLGNQNE